MQTSPELSPWDGRSTVGWSAIVAGAALTTALFTVFVAFGLSLGLGLASTAPTWRDASFALWLLSGVYLLLAALTSNGLGAYVAGRMRGDPAVAGDQPEFHAGARGLLVWAVALILSTLLTLALTRSLTPVAAPGAGSPGPAAAVGAENLIASELDRLFRGARRPAEDLSYLRAEAGRILLTASGHDGVTADDRRYLSALVQGTTGLAPPEAERRVADVVARAGESLARGRRVGVLMGFITCVAMLLSAALAWYASVQGERDARGSDGSAFQRLLESRWAPTFGVRRGAPRDPTPTSRPSL
jgi:hypothetical protein